jgi:hypothetical protein
VWRNRNRRGVTAEKRLRLDEHTLLLGVASYWLARSA